MKMLEKWKVPFCFTILKGILWDGEFFFLSKKGAVRCTVSLVLCGD